MAAEIKKKERLRKAAYRTKIREKEIADKVIEGKRKRNTGRSSIPISSMCSDSDSDDELHKITELTTKVKTLQQKLRRQKSQSVQKASCSQEAVRKRAQRARTALPQSPNRWAETMMHLLKHASPNRAAAFSRRQKKRAKIVHKRNMEQRLRWRSAIEDFMRRDDITRQMPNKRDVVTIDGIQVAKRHLLMPKKQAYMTFVEETPTYPYRYTTFRKSIPRFIKKMNLNDRRVCICMHCFNMEELLRPLSATATKLQMDALTIRSVYKQSLCDFDHGTFPSKNCIDRKCAECNKRLWETYEEMLERKGNNLVKYTQWEHIPSAYTNSKGVKIKTKTWKQVDHKETVAKIFDKVADKLPMMIRHVFRNDFQHQQHHLLQQSLPENHVILYGDFSQNYALITNDEIESAHYGTPQATLHTWYLIRHASASTPQQPQLTKEAVAMISDNLKHDTHAVFNFTKKIIHYMQNNPEKVGLPAMIHRITDNCGFEYKCRNAFAHMFDLEEIYGVRLVYHYSEPGHGKGPHDGIGATIKHGLDRLILADKVRLRSAYEAYLAAAKYLSDVGRLANPSQKKSQEFSKRTIIFVPASKMDDAPVTKNIKAVQGTQNLRSIQVFSKSEVLVANLSCACSDCYIRESTTQCQLSEWRETHVIQFKPTADPKVIHFIQTSFLFVSINHLYAL